MQQVNKETQVKETILYPELESFFWNEKILFSDFQIIETGKTKLRFCYETRLFEIRNCDGKLYLFMNGDIYSKSPIYIQKDNTYKINLLAFRQGFELCLSRYFVPEVATFYVKDINNQNENFVSKYIIENPTI